jgi:hypothetical protein
MRYPQRVGPGIAAAATLLWPSQFNTQHIMGQATTIENLLGPAGSSSHLVHGGDVMLILGAAHAFAASGNIRPTSTSPRTPGSTAVFRRSPRDDLWYEMGPH